MTWTHRILPWLLAAAALTFTVPAWAHGGEDDESPAASATVTASGSVTAFATSETYELVIKSSALVAKHPQDIKLLLSDYLTNRPVEGAAIELELSGPASAKVTAKPTSEKGIYVASLEAPAPGEYQVTASIERGETADLLTLDGLKVSDGASSPASGPGLGAILGASALIGLGAGGLWLLRRKKRHAATALVLLVPLALAPGAWAHAGHDDEGGTGAAPVTLGAPIPLAKESQFLLGVTTTPAQARRVAQRTTLLGRLQPPTQQVAALYAPQPGRIVSRIIADVGDRVRKGQVLAVVEQILSTSDQIQLASEHLKYSSERAQLQASIQQAEQDVAKARADYHRLDTLRDIVAGKQIADAAISLRKAEEALQGLKAQRAKYDRMAPPSLEQARRFQVVAPFDGVVSEAHATFGETVDPAKLLFHVVDPRTLWLVADVYERDLAKVTRAKGGTVTIDALPGASFPAVLESLGTVLDEQTRTLKARFVVDNAQGRLKGGMFGRINVAVGGTEDVIAVPAPAVTEFDGKQVVFVHTAPEVFEAHEVSPGPADGGWMAVQGLQAGQRVVTEGVYQLKSVAEKGARK